jgi:mycoketide-CoA synthase
VFPGQGSQWVGMGVRLLEESPVFAARMAECEAALAPYVDWSLTKVLRDELTRVDVVQPVLWAVMVSLAAVWESAGVIPAAVVGHSQGEIAAACVAGALSLEDGARIVALRSKALRQLAGHGAMASLAIGEDQARGLLGGCTIAAVNGPSSTVISGPPAAVAEVVAAVQATGARARLVDVDYASHGPQIDQLTDLPDVLAGLHPRSSEVAFYSTVTAGRLDGTALDTAYWIGNLRQPVRFADTIQALIADGHGVFIEASPHPILTIGMQETSDEIVTVPTLRRDEGDLRQLTLSIAHAFVAGIDVDWTPWIDGGRLVDLPTYAFQRERFWLPAAGPGAGRIAPGLLPVVVPLADGGVVLTGRLAATGWPADHAVGGSVLVAGAVLLDWALRAADEVGCAGVEELTLEAPLVLSGTRTVQVVAGPPDADGHCGVTVHSRQDGGDWVTHATGVLGGAGPEPQPWAGAWPPPGAEPLDLTGFYEAAAAAGYDYGPAFQGLRAAWRHGGDLLAEVGTSEPVGDFGLHPVLLDAALHPLLLDRTDDQVRLPFTWTGVRLHATGATTVRVRLTADGDRIRVVVADPAGAPVLDVASLVTRPADPDQLRPRVDGLFTLDWQPVPAAPATGPWITDLAELPDPVPPRVFHRAADAAGALDAVRAWLAEPRADASTLVMVTSGAVATDDPDPDAAAVWGLVRCARLEHPDRFVLVDGDPVVLADGEPEQAVRDGHVLTPTLVRTPARAGAPVILDGPVLVTGGTGRLGSLVAEHLAREWGVRDLVLVSRRGPDAPGAAELVARLADTGARARIVAADVSDADAVRGLVAGIDRLAGVVHAAGVLDDATVTGTGLETVWAAKATAARNLDEATRGLPLTLFAVFSSAAAALGSPGQANYAAANAYCDALVLRRRAAGLPGVSIGWGLWAATSTLTAGADRDRMGRAGMRALDTGRALALFDAAVRDGRGWLLAADLRPETRPRRRAAAEGPQAGALAGRLAGLDADARRDAVTEVVRECVAVVLGHRSPGQVRAGTAFKDLGFDSLTAVELRNRLAAATGLRLPATMVFDHPTPGALAAHLDHLLAGTSSAAVVSAPAATDEPIAIVSMACRYPGGVASPDDLWRLLAEGADAIGEFPADRGWDLDGLFHPDPDHPGTTYAREGGFLPDAATFDAGFFGISPREALAMDPQQRLLLESSWELIERAGIDPQSLRGTATGVYAGVMYHDYAPAGTDGYAYLAGSGSIVSGRVAYQLGLEGPAVTVDTACSSSLVAIHLAAQALRAGECSLALAGGVTVMADPTVFVGFARQRGLSPDGRCRAFAASADGTGFSEGVGLVLLERLSDAHRNGHQVLAVVRGSAVNQDGASNGLTAPNGPSQERVIRQALANAGLAPSDVDAVEAHGTGTTLGDPIEAQAVLATYGQDRSAPLWLGSVKSNLGHTQAAAGVAGVIKMVMAMRKGMLPPTLHVDEPTPHVDWSTGQVRLLTGPVEWSGPRRAGVSSFGASGTNAHLVLEAGPAAEPEPEPTDQVLPWVLSARSDRALRDQADRLGAFVAEHPDVPAAAIGSALVRTRAVLDHRAVVVGGDRGELLAGLREPSTGPATDGAAVWLFSGQGSQRVGMGAGLYERFGVFAAAVDEVCAQLDPRLREVMFHGPEDRLDHTTYAQTALFALQVGLARLLESCGLRPGIVIGHSVGEIAAAHVAGVFDLPDACRLVAARATLMGGLPTGGAMAAIEAPADEIADGLDGDVVIAAINGPRDTVVSGPAGPVDAVVADWAARGHRTRRLAVSHAFHSPLMEPILDRFGEEIAGLTFHRPRLPLISNLTGLPAGDDIAGPDYWVRQIRGAVRFGPAVAHVAGRAGTFLELGPDPVLLTAAQRTLDPATPVLVPALNQRRDDQRALAEALGRLHTAGVDVDWAPWFPTAHRVELPTYAFQRERFWPSSDSGGLTGVVPLASGGVVLSGRLSATGWPADHTVSGSVIVAGAVLVDWALRAADEVGCAGVEELTLHAPMTLPAAVQLVVGPVGEDGRRELTVHSRQDGGDWATHATGVLGTPPEVPAITASWPPAGAEPIDLTGFYDRIAQAGYGYGPAFRNLRAAWRHGEDLLAEVVFDGPVDGVGIHPALLDAALHPLLLDRAGDGVWLPFSWTGVRLHATGATTVRVRLETGGEQVRVTITDPTGAPVLGVESLVLRPGGARPQADGLFTVEWQPATGTQAVEGPWVAGLDEVPEPVPPRVFLRAADVARVLEVAQGWVADPLFAGSTLVVVTRGMLDGDPDAAAVWGLVRSAQAEHPGRFMVVDGEPSLLAEESQLAVRDGQLLVPRLVRATGGDLAALPGERDWRVDTTAAGSLDGLALVPRPEESPRPGEVRLDVHAAGLNFRDVLVALGMVPGQTGIGGEGAGVVTEVGPGVKGLSVGDRVMGVLDGSFGPTVVADARMLAPLPAGWGMREAAGVPVAFLTAWYGLVELAHLAKGERVLVHAATGGVGMAAVQIARHVGAEVFATASPGKHRVLAGMGIDGAHRASSRDAGFEAAFGPVDVVLNSVTGELLDASWRMLRPGGRFLEIGKTDVRTGLGPDYLLYDLVTDAGPDAIGRMLAELVALFESGALTPPPVTAWPLARVREAMRVMSQARHTGKLVLDVPPAAGTVLITGGSGTLAGLVAEHLVGTWGVRHLVLASRSGTAESGLLTRLREAGAEVETPVLDVADEAAVRKLVDEHALTGVIHAAGVVDDAVLTETRLDTVWAPKVLGAANLDRATRDHRLAFFTVFSSAAGTLGSPGQANYAAANAWCDALMRRRRAEGLPGQSIAWGLWAEASGMTGHLSQADRTRMSRAGLRPLPADRALALLDAATRHGGAHLVAADLDPRVLSADTPAARPAAATAGPVDLADRLAGLTAADQHRTLLELVRTQAAAVLGHRTSEQISPTSTFKDLGFDSLTAVELRNRLAAGTGLRLPAALVFDYPDATALADYLQRRLVPAAESPVLDELARLESMPVDGSDAAAVTARLEALLATWKAAGGLSEGTAAERLQAATADQVLDFIDNELGV